MRNGTHPENIEAFGWFINILARVFNLLQIFPSSNFQHEKNVKLKVVKWKLVFASDLGASERQENSCLNVLLYFLNIFIFHVYMIWWKKEKFLSQISLATSFPFPKPRSQGLLLFLIYKTESCLSYFKIIKRAKDPGI